MLRAFICAVIGAAAMAGCQSIGVGTGQPPKLAKMRDGVQASLYRLDESMAAAAEALSAMALDSPEARRVLAGVCAEHPEVADCVIVDGQGVIVAAEPEAYGHVEGESVADQAHVKEVRDSGAPVLSGVFRAVEGYGAAVLQYPIPGGDGAYRGAVSALIRPAQYFAEPARAIAADPPWDCWVMATGGVVVFDPDPLEVGRNVFTDPIYRGFDDLKAMARRVAAQPRGRGVYTYLSRGLDRPTEKKAYWDTVALHDTEWRIVVVRETQ